MADVNAPSPDQSLALIPKKISDHCEDAWQFYSEKPGLFGPGTAMDLYQVCKVLSERVEELETKVQQLLEPVR